MLLLVESKYNFVESILGCMLPHGDKKDPSHLQTQLLRIQVARLAQQNPCPHLGLLQCSVSAPGMSSLKRKREESW